MSAAIKFGLYFFAVRSGVTLIQYLAARDTLFNPTIGFVTGIGFSILFIVLSIKADRADESGYTMGEGIKAGMITYGIGTLLTSIFMYVLFTMIDPSLVDEGLAFAKEVAEKTADTMAGFMGADEAVRAEMMDELSKQEIANPYTAGKIGLGWVLGLVGGLIMSLICAAIMKKN